MTRCAVCQQPVHVLPNDQRQGSEGLPRCTDHAGQPLPPDIQDRLDDQLEPTAGIDYHIAQQVRLQISYTVTIGTTALVWASGAAEGRPVDPDNDPTDRTFGEHLDRDDTEITDVHHAHTTRGKSTGDPVRLTEDGDPFNERAYRRDAIADELDTQPVPNDPTTRPENTLEVFTDA